MTKIASPFFHNASIAQAFQGLAGNLQVDGTDVARRRLLDAQATGQEGENNALNSLAGIFQGGDMSNSAGISDFTRQMLGAGTRSGMTGNSISAAIRAMIANGGGGDEAKVNALVGSGVPLGKNASVSLEGQSNLIDRDQAQEEMIRGMMEAGAGARNTADNAASRDRNTADNKALAQRNDADNASRAAIAAADRNRPKVAAGASVYEITPQTVDEDGATIASAVRKLLTAPTTPNQASKSPKTPLTVWDMKKGQLVRVAPHLASDQSRYLAKTPFQINPDDRTTQAIIARAFGDDVNEIDEAAFPVVSEIAQLFINHSGRTESEAIRAAVALLTKSKMLIDPAFSNNIGISPDFDVAGSLADLRARLTADMKD